MTPDDIADLIGKPVDPNTLVPDLTADEVADLLNNTDQPDPVFGDIDYTGNVETDANAEVDAIATAFRQRRKNEDQRFNNKTDTEYWFCVHFPDRALKDRFLAHTGLDAAGDKYLGGLSVADILDVDMTDDDT